MNIGLVKGRHLIPNVNKFLFTEEITDVTDVKAIEAMADSAIKALPTPISRVLNLYVTGLTVALIAVLNAVRRDERFTVKLWHFNSATGEYFAQSVEDWTGY